MAVAFLVMGAFRPALVLPVGGLLGLAAAWALGGRAGRVRRASGGHVGHGAGGCASARLAQAGLVLAGAATSVGIAFAGGASAALIAAPIPVTLELAGMREVFPAAAQADSLCRAIGTVVPS